LGPPGQQQQVASNRDEGETPVDVTPGHLDDKTLVAARMRDAVHECDGQLIAMPGFSTAARKLAPRAPFVGWTPRLRGKNLALVIDDPRFLILLWIVIPNLSSHSFSASRRQLPGDWTERYNVTPVLIALFIKALRGDSRASSELTWKGAGGPREVSELAVDGQGRHASGTVAPRRAGWLGSPPEVRFDRSGWMPVSPEHQFRERLHQHAVLLRTRLQP